MANPLTEARRRQLARLNGAKSPAPRAAIALAKSQAYQDAAEAPSTLRAYAGDLANFRAWCEKHGFTPMPATPEIVGAYLAAAGEGYAIRHWPGLCAFLDDGRIEMDTNVVERAIRPITLNRKNALFAGSDGGARHWAIAMTLIQTAKLNGVEPMEWLTDVLEHIVSGRTKSHELESLLSWNWQPSKAASTGKHPALPA